MANEKRLLIDANGLGRYLVKKFGLISRYETGEILMAIDSYSCINEAGAVEVCFCKDCKHMETLPNNLRWCNAWGRFNGAGDDGYCNYGEKRESGTQPQREE